MVRLYEAALRLDPSSVLALTGLVNQFVGENSFGSGWGSFEKRSRAKAMLARATALAPDSEEVLMSTENWLRYEPAGCPQAIVAAQKLIDRFPNDALGYAHLGFCKTEMGHPEEEVELVEKALRLNPSDPNLYYRYRRMGMAACLLGRDEQAIVWLARAQALNPGAIRESLNSTYRYLAVAYAHTGRVEEAQRTLAAANKLWPFDTL